MLIFIVAFLAAALLTPTVGRAAIKLGIVDRPNAHLKNHRQPTPYFGGVAVFIAVSASVLLFWEQSLGSSELIGLAAGAFIVATGGLLDDWRALKPWAKLGFQLAAGICAIGLGLKAELFDGQLFDLLVTIVWIVGVTNAFNLIDIMDGLAAGIAGVASLFMGLLLTVDAGSLHAVIPLALSGACFGFLMFNFNPASIFLGDAGSQLLGYMLACLSLYWTADAHNTHQFWIPLLLLGVPLFETIFISVLRLKAGQSPFLGSKDHFALRMLRLGLSVRATVMIAYLFTIFLGLTAMLLFLYPASAAYLLGVVLFAFLLAAFRLGRIDMSTG